MLTANDLTRCRCSRCGASLRAAGDAGTEPPCGVCLLLAGLGEEPLPPPAPSLSAPEPDLAAASPPDDGVGLQLGGYVLLRELGHGSMGVIYEARQAGTGRPVALKTIARTLRGDPDVRTRFAREAETAASLDHPYILPIYEVGEEDCRPYFTMKLAEGGNLLKVLPSFAGRPREAVALMVKIIRGIAHAHAHGVLHRDLKPSNVLLEADGETPLVSDFGLARWLDQDSNLTQSLVVFGTPGYMAPEQARQAGTAGPAADIYSLGAMLFQLLCGRTPFRGTNALEVVEQARAGPAPRLRTFSPKAARHLETICARCLEIEPDRRPKCAADLADDLERWLTGDPIRMHPVRAPERAWRWTGRNPWLAGAAASCLLLGGAAAAWQRETLRLEAAIREDAMAKATVVVLPLETLDTDDLLSTRGREIDAALEQQFVVIPGARMVTGRAGPENDAGWPVAWQRAGRENHAPAIISGSVRHRVGRNGEKLPNLRMVLCLARTADGRALSRRVVDFAPEDLAPATAAFIQLVREAPHLLESPSVTGEFVDATENVEARECLRSGKEIFLRSNPNDLPQCVALFERAAKADPACAEAHAWLASACVARGWVEPGERRSHRAREEAEHALRLDPWLAEGHRALGAVFRQQGDVAAATEAVLTAYELDPAEPRHAPLVARQWQSLGRLDLAVRWFERAERRQTCPGMYAGHLGDLWLDFADDATASACYQRSAEFRPGSQEGLLGAARMRLLQANFQDARELCRRLAVQYANYGDVHMMAAQTEFFGRDFPAAEASYRHLVSVDRTGGESFCGGVGNLCALGYLRRLAGDGEESRRLLDEARAQALAGLQRSPGDAKRCFALAAACAAASEIGPALDALERAAANGWLDYRSLALDPRFDPLADEPRFRQFLSRIASRVASMRRGRPTVATTVP